MLPQTGSTIHWSELPPAREGMACAAEWETYRREVGRLLAEGHEGKFALLKGDKVVDVYDTEMAAREAGSQRYSREPHIVRAILSREPVIRGPMGSLLFRR